MYGHTILSDNQFHIYTDEINVIIPLKEDMYKTCRFAPIFEYENYIPTSQSESDRTHLTFRKDNNLIGNPLIIVFIVEFIETEY